MNLLLQDKGKKAAALEESIEQMQDRIDTLRNEIDLDESLMDLIGSSIWKQFVKSVLSPEKTRLATRRMDIPVDDRDAHLRIEGQYDEVVILSRKSEEVQDAIETNLRELAVTEGKLAEAKSRLAKTKE